LVRGRASTIKAPIYLNGALVAPTASGSSVSVYDSSNTAIVDSGAVTVTGSIAEYTIAAGNLPATLALSVGWRIEWTLVLAAAVKPDGVILARNPAALVRWPIQPVVSDEDLWGEVPSLDPAGSAPITSLTTYQTSIDAAWRKILLRLVRGGDQPHLIMEPSALYEPHLQLTLSLIFADLATRLNPAYRDLAADHRELYEGAWIAMAPEYDVGDDGQADPRRRSASPAVSLCGGRDSWYPGLGARYGSSS